MELDGMISVIRKDGGIAAAHSCGRLGVLLFTAWWRSEEHLR
jgi:hypothetical protein